MQLTKKLKDKSATIGILGLGYVGLPLMIRYSQESYKVLGFDIDNSKVDDLNAGRSYIEHIPTSDIEKARKAGFEATTDFARIKDVDAIIICVPTPLDEYREPDLSFVLDTVDTITPFLRKDQVVSLESTTYPGTTDEELMPRLEYSGMEVGTELFLVYSPEREDPGNKDFTTKTIPKVVGGVTKSCLEVGIALYEGIIDRVVPVSSTRTAEMVKLMENIHRAVNIGLANEMKIVADRMGINIHEVVEAAATKPFGFVPYYPGPGLGGHCIPIDPFYLTWKARAYGLHTRFIELAGEINGDMPKYVVQKITDGLNNAKKPLRGSRILVLGIAYKKNIDDMRESPSVHIMELLREKGAEVAYSDPHVPVFPRMRKHRFDLKSIELNPETVNSYDCVVLSTDHDSFDYAMLAESAQILVDTRGKLDPNLANVVLA